MTFGQSIMLETVESISPCQSIIYSVFQREGLKRAGAEGGVVVALLAAHPNAGTTYVTSQLHADFNRDRSGSALAFSGSQLANELPRDEEPAPVRTLERFRGRPAASWRSDGAYRAKLIDKLRKQAEYVLIDCQPLRNSNEALGVADLVDGFLLVVEANRTTREQLAYLERSLTQAGGRILGHVLNKRTYPIPQPIFSRLEMWGL